MSSETKAFIVKHDLGNTTISLPKEGFTLNIRMPLETCAYLVSLLVIMGAIAAVLIQLLVIVIVESGGCR